MSLSITVAKRSPRCQRCWKFGHTRLHCDADGHVAYLPAEFPPARHDQVIYALVIDGVIKVGTSRNLRERIRYLAAVAAKELPVVLGVRLGDFADESALKRAVRRFALLGQTEWLRDAPELRNTLEEWQLNQIVIPDPV